MIQLFRGDLYDKFGEQRLSLYQECVVPEDIHIPMEGNRIPRGGGVQKEAISKGVGGGGTCRGFSPVGLSKIAELLTNKNALNIGIKSHLLGD